MNHSIEFLALLTALFYLLHAAGLFTLLRKKIRIPHYITLLALLPAAMQAMLLHLLIDTPVGQNLNLINIAGMVSWLIVLLLMIPGRHLSAPLLLFVLPIAALLSGLAPFLPAAPIRPLTGEWMSLAHILTALLAYSLMMVAAMQAAVLWWLEKQLRMAPLNVSAWLPPLQLQEAFLFRVISAGFVLLSSSIVIATFGVDDAFSQSPLHKTVLGIMSWIVFGILLLGRHRYGWRGRIAIRWTLTGFALLALSYVGTRFVLEFLLNPR